MNISKLWLENYLQHPWDAQGLSKALTDCGLEVESMELCHTIPGGLEGVVIGKVLTCEPHPDSDHLHVTTVDVGTPTPLSIVCGAANVAAGQKVPVATIGTKIYQGEECFEIKKSKLRGVPSEGMICAEDELNLGSSHEGILVLDPQAPVGMKAADYFGVASDTVYGIGLTPNRGDAASHLGVARDLVAVLAAQHQPTNLQIPSVEAFAENKQENPIRIDVQNPELCPRYSGLSMRNIHVKESPKWLKDRLHAVGLRPINNIVDCTNFVLMELGQPLHAFDADRISGQTIVVRQVEPGTKFITLDGIERSLQGSELMICDAQKPLCIAGVFGGLHSGVSTETNAIFLESAYFNPVSVRKTSKLHGLKTDASFRYERGTDPQITRYALQRAALLIQELAGGEIIGSITDCYPNPIEKPRVRLRFEAMNRLIGAEIPLADVLQILKALDFEVLKQDPEGLDLAIPTIKSDVLREPDVVEEILRIYGYNRIQGSQETRTSLTVQPKPDAEKIYNLIAEQLTGMGLSEAMNNSFTRAQNFETIAGFDSARAVHVANPLSNELDVMRPSLLFGLLTNVAYNCKRSQTDIGLYEFGKTYAMPSPHQYEETRQLAIVLSGNARPESWQEPAKAQDFFRLKNGVLKIFDRLRLNVQIDSEIPPFLSEGLSYRLHGKPCAYLGRVSTETLQAFDVDQEVYFAEFNWDQILKALPTTSVVNQEVSKFPAVRRDLALLVDHQVSFADLEKIARATEKKLLQTIDLFDVYEGKNLPAGKKSYALSFLLQDPEKTLSDKQITAVMENLIKQFSLKLGATLR